MRKFLTAVCVIGASVAAVVIPQDAQATPLIDQTQSLTSIGSGGPVCMNGFMNINDLAGTTFTAGRTGALTSIDIPLLWTTTTEDMLVSVYSTVNGLPNGSAIASQIIPASSLVPFASGGTLSVNFTNPASLVSGTSYVFALGFPTCTQNAQASFSIVSSVPDRLFTWKQGSQAWSQDNIQGMNFTTYVEVAATPSPTPTPSSTVAATSSDSGVLASTGADSRWQIFSLGGFLFLAFGLGIVLRTRRQLKR